MSFSFYVGNKWQRIAYTPGFVNFLDVFSAKSSPITEITHVFVVFVLLSVRGSLGRLRRAVVYNGNYMKNSSDAIIIREGSAVFNQRYISIRWLRYFNYRVFTDGPSGVSFGIFLLFFSPPLFIFFLFPPSFHLRVTGTTRRRYREDPRAHVRAERKRSVARDVKAKFVHSLTAVRSKAPSHNVRYRCHCKGWIYKQRGAVWVARRGRESVFNNDDTGWNVRVSYPPIDVRSQNKSAAANCRKRGRNLEGNTKPGANVPECLATVLAKGTGIHNTFQRVQNDMFTTESQGNYWGSEHLGSYTFLWITKNKRYVFITFYYRYLAGDTEWRSIAL